MPNPVCLSPLKFYDALKKQERYKSYAYGHISPVVMPLGVLQPFQFVLNDAQDEVTEVHLYNANTDARISENIITGLIEIGLRHHDVQNFRVVMFPGVFPLTNVKHEGLYYLRLKTNKAEYFSEIFCFTSSLDDYLELEYWNPESDFFLKNGVVTFANNFRFKLLLKSELGKPEYGFEEEATKRLGYSFIESQVSKKVYKFNVLLPEFLCDALRIVRLCSNKRIVSKGEEYDLLSFEMDAEWQTQGDIASVSCEFEVDNIITNLGGFMQQQPGGDFNLDFNNDFKLE